MISRATGIGTDPPFLERATNASSVIGSPSTGISKTVYNVFWHWRNDGTWQNIHDMLCRLVRKKQGKKATPSVGIIDSQSMDTTEVGGKERGYDAAKNVSGRKRHIVVDTLGLIMAVVIHAADIQDQHGAKLVIEALDRGADFCVDQQISPQQQGL